MPKDKKKRSVGDIIFGAFKKISDRTKFTNQTIEESFRKGNKSNVGKRKMPKAFR
jgi:hypothetical protein